MAFADVLCLEGIFITILSDCLSPSGSSLCGTGRSQYELFAKHVSVNSMIAKVLLVAFPALLNILGNRRFNVLIKPRPPQIAPYQRFRHTHECISYRSHKR